MNRPVKQWLSIADQIILLQSRGMRITDPSAAELWLETVGYYRLSGYWYPYRSPEPGRSGRRLSDFLPGTDFAEVTKLYDFDRHLKTLVLAAIERIEVAVRSRTGYLLGEIDPMAHTVATNFRPTFDHAAWSRTVTHRISRALHRDEAVAHHHATYGGHIPIWVLTDVLDFSDLSKAYAGLRSDDQRTIADYFGVTVAPDASKGTRQRWARHPPLANWLENLTVVRNICAHHGRLWNRQLTPIGASQRIRHLGVFADLPEEQSQVERLYGTIEIISHLLATVAPGSDWPIQIRSLINGSFAGLPHRSLAELGIPADWAENPASP